MKRFVVRSAVFACALAVSGSERDPSAGGRPDFLGALVNSVMTFSPKCGDGGMSRASTVDVSPEELFEIGQSLAEVVQVLHRSGKRREAHLSKLRVRGIEEEPMSDAGTAFEVEVLGNRFAFDRYGCLRFDDRFVKPAERKALDRLERVYRRVHARWHATRETEKSAKRAGPSAIADRAAEWRVRRVPVFKGFEDDRYQEHDGLIVRCVDEFNRNRAAWAGATSGQAKRIPPLTTALVKSHMIEESGGRDPKSRAAWDVDPGQVNVPGDWSDAKKGVGLSKPSRRNEGTPEQNIRAAIKFLVRKGFGVSGQPASRRPAAVFDDWKTALRRYNGRDDEMSDGRSYCETYADHIMARARDPGRFVAIRKKVRK